MDWKSIGPLTALFFTVTSTNLGPSASAAHYVSFPGNTSSILKKYDSFLQEFKNRHCSKDLEAEYEKRLKAYQAFGSPIPTMGANEIDRSTITEALPLLKEKKAWLTKLYRDFQKSKFSHDKVESIIRNIQKNIDQALIEKYRHRFARNETDEKKAVTGSQKQLFELRSHFDQLLSTVFFLKSFQFPVDHLANRKRYEELRLESGPVSEKEKRALGFKRKILEDGSPDKSGVRKDTYIRSAMDTIYLALNHSKSDFLEEDLRYDLEWSLGKIEWFSKQKKSEIAQRLKTWRDQTAEQVRFYENLLNQKKLRKKALADLQSRATAWRALSNFVYDRHAEVWKSLSSEPEWHQALFAMDMILLNEVGLGTARNEDDRKDIIQLVINRSQDSFYSAIDQSEPIAARIKDIPSDRTPSSSADRKWLNTLFKEGEFSFTLPYIQSVTKIYCPDISRYVRSTRTNNLRFSIDLLKNPNWEFPALRFYSRNSMFGKIDMSEAWPDYEKLPEQPGNRIRKAWNLRKKISGGKFRYFYTFKYQNQTYDVLEINNRTYAVRDLKRNPKFYLHRNRHYFAFFKKSETAPPSGKSALRAIEKFRRHFQTSQKTSSAELKSRPY